MAFSTNNSLSKNTSNKYKNFFGDDDIIQNNNNQLKNDIVHLNGKQLLTQYFHDYLEFYSLLYTFYGFRGKEDLYTKTSNNKYLKTILNFYIDTFIKVNNLLLKPETPFRHEYRLIIEHARMNIYYYNLPFIYIPLNHKSNPITQFIAFSQDDRTFLKTEDDFKKYLLRINNFRNHILDICKMALEGLQKGFSSPKTTILFMIKQLDNILVNRSYRVKVTIPTRYKKEYNHKIDKIILPTILHFKNFLTVYLKHCRDTVGLYDCHRFSKIGLEMYDYIVNRHITLKISPKEIHQIGLDEVARINIEMNKIKSDMGHSTMDIKTFYNKIIFKQFKDEKEILDTFEKYQKDNLKIVKKNFPFTISKVCNIKPIPKFKRLGNIAYYYSPSIKPLRKGTFFINTDPTILPTCVCKALSIHEMIPGHHFQFQCMLDAKLSPFLIFLKNTAYVEGWALYCESLGDYTQEELFGKYMQEKLRAIRLVVDTGIHRFGWTKEQAMDYTTKNSLLPKAKIEKEIERYIAQPGQALGYKIGELFFKRKRNEWLAKGKNIKDYHKLILNNGILPLDTLEKIIDKNI